MSVTFQRSPAGAGTWTTICAPTAAPYTCSWNTAGVADGLYDLRAIALDASGYSRTSTVSSRRVDNTAPATGVSAATPLTGTATRQRHRDRRRQRRDLRRLRGAPVLRRQLDADLHRRQLALLLHLGHDGRRRRRLGRPRHRDRRRRQHLERRPPPTGSSTTPRRAITLTDPGSPLGGTVTLASTTGDGAGSGVASVAYQYRTSPRRRLDRGLLVLDRAVLLQLGDPAPTGTYDLRATATDGVSKHDDLRDRLLPPGRQHDPDRRRDDQPRHAAVAAP